MKHRLRTIGAASLLLGAVFNWLFFGHGLGLNFLVYVGLLPAVTLAGVYYARRPLGRTVVITALLAVLFSVALFSRANGFLQFLNCVTALYLLALVGVQLWHPERELQDFTAVDYLRRTWQLPFRSIAEARKVLRQALRFSLPSRPASSLQLLPVVRGILLSLPILLIFLLLFSSADLVFKQYVNSIFNGNFHLALSPQLIGRLVLLMLVTGFFVGLYCLLFRDSAAQADSALPPQSRTGRLGSIEATIILGSVAALFLLFVLVQLQYLFGGQNNILIAGGYTYADYARKGFFELIAVTVITLLLVLTLHSATRRQTLRQQYVFMALCAVLVLEVGLIMLSAHRRLSLYEQAYGFTSLRLYSHLFIGWLVAAFGLLLAYITRAQAPRVFARGIFVSALLFLLIVNFVNPDAFVARENIRRFQATGKLDVTYLGSLSADATPQVAELLHSKNQMVRKSIAHQLYNRQRRANEGDQSWQAFNISRHRARQYLQPYQTELHANANYWDLLPTSSE